jgi:hypothetical protein
MTDESRIGKLESDVKSLRDAFDLLRSEFLSFKTEVAKEFGSVRTSVESLRTAIERAKLWMVVTGAGTILSVWGAAVALARFLKP